MRNKKGFTLIELLAVIIILGVLMLVAVPSVTGYIASSRRSSYASTASEFIKSVGVLINKGSVAAYDTSTLYMVPVGNDETKSCVKLESGGKSPFSSTYDYMYVGVTYDGTSYDYYIIGSDSAGQGFEDDETTESNYIGKYVISSKRLEDVGGDIIKAGIEKNSVLVSNYGESKILSSSSNGTEYTTLTTSKTGSNENTGNINDAITKINVGRTTAIDTVQFFSPSDCKGF